MCFSSRPCSSAVALRSGPLLIQRSNQAPQRADLARMVGQTKSFVETRLAASLFAAETGQASSLHERLLRIQFDNQLLVHRQLNVLAFRQRNHAPLVVLAI